MPDPYLRIHSVEKHYDGNAVLKAVSLDIHEGEFFFLIGPSGCGKTTLLRILSGLLEPDSGEVFLKGKNITEIPAHKRDLNTVFQNYALFPHLSVFDNVAFGLKMKKVPKNEIKERVNEVLDLVQMGAFGNRKIGTLSGGQKQRISLARALVNEPAILLLDEPLGALDVKLRKLMQHELKNLQRKLGTTFICVTHDQEEAMTMADRIAVLNEGQIYQIGTPSEVYNQPENHFVASFMGDMNFLEAKLADTNHQWQTAELTDGTKVRSVRCDDPFDQVKEVGVRPECLSIVDEHNSVQSTDNSLSGTITQHIFVGNVSYLIFESDSGLTLRILGKNQGMESNHHSGRCRVVWSPENTLFFDS